jgi:orotate phosphoribosyltransferase-like protein
MLDWFDDAQKLHSQGLGYKKIAKALNMPVTTVSNRFARNRGITPPQPPQQINIQTSILKDLQRDCTIQQLCDRRGITEL